MFQRSLVLLQCRTKLFTSCWALFGELLDLFMKSHFVTMHICWKFSLTFMILVCSPWAAITINPETFEMDHAESKITLLVIIFYCFLLGSSRSRCVSYWTIRTLENTPLFAVLYKLAFAILLTIWMYGQLHWLCWCKRRLF